MAWALSHAREPVRSAILDGKAERLDFSIEVPHGMGVQFQVDWTTGETHLDAVTQVHGTAHPGGSGCILLPGFILGNVSSPIPTSPLCTPTQPHVTPITTSVLACVTITVCFLDGVDAPVPLPGDPPEFSVLFMVCVVPGGASMITWGTSQTSTVTCFVISFGDSPNTWTNWTGLVGKHLAGFAVGIHND